MEPSRTTPAWTRPGPLPMPGETGVPAAVPLPPAPPPLPAPVAPADLVPLPGIPDAGRTSAEPARLPTVPHWTAPPVATIEMEPAPRQAPPPPHPKPMGIVCPKCARVAVVLPSNRLDDRPTRCRACGTSLASVEAIPAHLAGLPLRRRLRRWSWGAYSLFAGGFPVLLTAAWIPTLSGILILAAVGTVTAQWCWWRRTGQYWSMVTWGIPVTGTFSAVAIAPQAGMLMGISLMLVSGVLGAWAYLCREVEG